MDVTKRHSRFARVPPLVLVAEDYDDARELYRLVLSLAGFRVVEAANGLEAVEKATALAPALIIMDLSMPTMNGIEAIDRLRRDTRTRATPILVVTAQTSARRLIGSGSIDGFCTKPCPPSELVDTVRRLIEAGPHPVEPSLAPA
jgi:CheY-like chemotaxis protein